MANITTRTGKGSALTHSELDANFTNLNDNKAELDGSGKVPTGILPAVYFSGGTGTGTISDPYVFGGGFSQTDLEAYLTGLPNFSNERVLSGALTWVDLPDSSLEKLATPTISFGTPTGDSVLVKWTLVTNGITYTLQKASDNTFADATTIFNATGTGFTATGLQPTTQYYFRVKASATGFNASNYSVGNITTDVAGNVTPAAPTMVADDTNNTLTISHSRGESEILVSVNNTTYVALSGVTNWNSSTHKIDVGNVARSAGYWKAKTKSATGFNESGVASSDAFTTSVITPATPTSPVTNSTDRTFNWTYSTGFTTATDYEFTLNSGSTYANVTVKPIVVDNNAYGINTVGVRVKAQSGLNTASATLFNSVAFTSGATATVALTSWQTPITGGTLSGNSLMFTTAAGVFGGARGNYYIPAGGSGWVESTSDFATNGAIILASGSTTYGDRNSGGGIASPLAMDYANSRYQCWYYANDSFANPRPSYGANTKGRIRLDGTNAYYECSTDAGATWQLMRTVAQPQVDLYVKAWCNFNSTNIPLNNIRGYNLTAI
ncbi:hypothetical protein [Pedobacter steynii]